MKNNNFSAHQKLEIFRTTEVAGRTKDNISIVLHKKLKEGGYKKGYNYNLYKIKDLPAEKIWN